MVGCPLQPHNAAQKRARNDMERPQYTPWCVLAQIGWLSITSRAATRTPFLCQLFLTSNFRPKPKPKPQPLYIRCFRALVVMHSHTKPNQPSHIYNKSVPRRLTPRNHLLHPPWTPKRCKNSPKLNTNDTYQKHENWCIDVSQ